MRWWLIICGLLGLFTFVSAQNHPLISEIQVSPESQEFIEIFNPNPFSLSLDNYYLTDYNTYYQLVNSVFSTASGDFLVKFPAGTTIDSAGVLVMVVDGSVFSGTADFELKSNSALPDMTPLYLGSSVSLSNQEMVMMFFWDGQSDLVSDIDYAGWGSTSSLTDKSGISIDGPDPDTTPSIYLNDTPVTFQQYFPTAPITGQSMARISVSENGETVWNGNGIQGHDETSEPIEDNFQHLQTPTPGTSELVIPSGNGSGLAYIHPDSVLIDSTLDVQIIVKGTIQEVLVELSVTVPASWTWSGLSGDVSLSGPGFSGAGFTINGQEITISLAQVNLLDSGRVEIRNLTSPSQPEESNFEVKTAIAGGVLTAMSSSPVITVWRPVSINTIAEIQANPSAFTSVTIEGIVVLGSGITTTGWTDAYVQDNSYFGMTAPMQGSRSRLQAEKYFGSVDIFTTLIDYRQYFKLRPLSLAFRFYNYAMYGKDAERGVMPPLFLFRSNVKH
ncbi:MAG: lamin tail domain-containing protein [Bacteroidales bacterium]|nr:lamin tail domain-containing protein [Bacteroidales bacterium]